MDIYHIARNLGYVYMLAYNRSYKAFGGIIKPKQLSPQEVDFEYKKAIREYARWNKSLHASMQKYDELEPLVSTFNRLKVLDRLEITRKSSSFDSKLLMDTWLFGSCNDNFAPAVSEFVSILISLQGTTLQLKHLIHDQLPTTFFALDTAQLQRLVAPLQYLQSLHLTFDATEPPELRFWEGFGFMLKSIPTLRNLRFGFAPFIIPPSREFNEAYWQDTNKLKNLYVPLWKVLGCHTWPCLETLRLDGLLLCENGISDILGRHKSTLRNLDLYNMALWQGSFKGLLLNIRETLSLETFHIWGFTRAFHIDDESWFLVPSSPVPSEPWRADFEEYYTSETNIWYPKGAGPDEYQTVREYRQQNLGRWLSEFVLQSKRQRRWPLDYSDALRSPYQRRRDPRMSPHTGKCEECLMSHREIDNKWESNAPPRANWEQPDPQEIDVVDERGEVLERYDSQGYNAYGYDENGYDTHGRHYNDFNGGATVTLRIRVVVANRIVLADVLNQIEGLDVGDSLARERILG